VEALETRLAPATLTVTVTTLSDEQDGGTPSAIAADPGPDGFFSLREAWWEQVGSTVIDFAGSLFNNNTTKQTTQWKLGYIDNESQVEDVTVNGPVDSNGNNLLTIDGANNGGTYGPFVLDGGRPFAHLTFNNINFQNFQTTWGGGLIGNTDATATWTFNHCTFSNNSTTSNGQGGINATLGPKQARFPRLASKVS
jgi:hypothetical protein